MKRRGWIGLRVVGFTVLGLGILLAIAVAALEPLVDWLITPGRAFDASVAPPPPRYEDAASWSALPDREDSADVAPLGSAAIDPRAADVDAFYVHPTSYVGSDWNAPTTDARLNADTDRVATGIQASAFNACCAVYAPRYRQANGTAYYRPSDDGRRAIDLAYDDVRRAFLAFQERRGGQRPFILAAHSQGAVLARRLLAEVIHGTPLREQLVAAYLVGGDVTSEGLREQMPDLAPCRAPDDLHCVVAYQARSPSFQPTRIELDVEDRRPRLCTNPLSWRPDGKRSPASENLGAVFLETDDHAPRPGFADAACADGRLLVTELDPVPRDLPSRLLDRVLGEGNYHAIEYQLYFMNLRANAVERSKAWVASRQSAGAGAAPP
ncbi:MAG: DUF3089 domain-containing protein [Labilithrix sp.]|nr:DUF3089 domain-containing protein [Labilithrix sp.]